MITQKFFGIQGELLKSVTERVQSFDTNVTSIDPQEILSLQEETVSEIKSTLAAYGYFKPSITLSKDHRNHCLNLFYTITPGKLFLIDKIEVQLTGEGEKDPAFQELLRHFPLQQGDAIRSKYYQQAKNALLDLAAERGYFSAKIKKSNILIDLKRDFTQVVISFDTGPRYLFGNLVFAPSPYSITFLERFVPFQYNCPYRNKKIMTLQENLGNSNLFQQVTVTPQPENADHLHVPIQIETIPRKPVQYSLGLGFGTDTGIRGLLDVQFHRLNPYGHTMELLLEPSEKLNHFGASYNIPGKNPVTDSYKFSVAAETQHLPTNGKSRYEKVEVSRINQLWGWQQTLSLGLRDEHSNPNDGRPTISSTMLLPNLNWTKVKSDNLLSPNCGYQMNVNLRGATKNLISNTDFIQTLIQGKTLLPISENLRLILRGQLGYTFISDIDELPITLQFYAGGAQTVRGYQYQQLGPGKTLLLGSIEVQRRIKGNLYAGIFYDTGSVNDVFARHFKSGLGLGLIWRSPIGAIEVTLTEALSLPGHPKLLQFSMGPEL